MTPTLRNLVREMLKESDAETRQRIFQLQAEIGELIRLETPIWDAIDSVDHPGTNNDDYRRLGQLHDELELLARQIREKVAERDALSDSLGYYRRRAR
jgi:hypothetical protein